VVSRVIYPESIERAITSIEVCLQKLDEHHPFRDYRLSPRSLALLLLQKDPILWQILERDWEKCQEMGILRTVAQNQLKYPLELAIAVRFRGLAERVLPLCHQISVPHESEKR
jgi:ferrous iron transport protein B